MVHAERSARAAPAAKNRNFAARARGKSSILTLHARGSRGLRWSILTLASAPTDAQNPHSVGRLAAEIGENPGLRII